MMTLRDRLLSRVADVDRHLCSIHSGDDYYSGNLHNLGSLFLTSAENPSAQCGVGPLGRSVQLNRTPPTAQTAGFAALQAITANVALTLTAGTGIVKGSAPDGSGAIVYGMDIPGGRGVSLTSLSNLSAINFTMTGYDQYGRKTTSTIAGPNANTVTFPKTVQSVLSIVPSATSASTVSAGTADLFGLEWVCFNGAYMGHIGWVSTTGTSSGANGRYSFANDTGTFVAADLTSPATASTGDPRGTYAPSSPSNGTTQLVIVHHMDGTQLGVNATLVNAIGVTPA